MTSIWGIEGALVRSWYVTSIQHLPSLPQSWKWKITLHEKKLEGPMGGRVCLELPIQQDSFLDPNLHLNLIARSWPKPNCWPKPHHANSYRPWFLWTSLEGFKRFVTTNKNMVHKQATNNTSLKRNRFKKEISSSKHNCSGDMLVLGDYIKKKTNHIYSNSSCNVCLFEHVTYCKHTLNM